MVSLKSANAYVYYFDKRSINQNYKKFGAYHGVEIPYALLTLEHEKGDSEIPKWALEYADKVSEYWVNFAKYGNPNASHLPEWEIWHPEKQQCMVFEDDIKSKTHPLKNRLIQLTDFLKDEPQQKNTGQVLKNL
jgi:para-nitrobenzyl esterase